MHYLLFLVALLLPVPAFASIRIPTSGELFAYVYTLVVFWTVCVTLLALAGIKLQKKLPLIILITINVLPFVLFFGYLFFSGIDSDFFREYVLGILLLCVTQTVLIYVLLHYLFYKSNVKNSVRYGVVGGILLFVAFFYPKELFQSYDTGMFIQNAKPQQCTCIGISSGKPGNLGYYCFGIPLQCIETGDMSGPRILNSPMPIQDNTGVTPLKVDPRYQ